LGTYESCPRKYKYEKIDKLPRKSFEHLDVGNYVHEVLEYFHKRLNEDATQHPETLLKSLAKEIWEKYKFKVSPEGLEKSKNLLKAYLGYVTASTWPTVLATEDRFSIDLSEDVMIRGVIDRIDRKPDGSLQIVDYKGLALDTPIPTPTGWTTMGDLKVGDAIFGSDGEETKVLVKSDIHNRPCYKITFSDHSEIVCDNVHLWQVSLVGMKIKDKSERVLNADQIFEQFNTLKESGAGAISVKNAKPLQYPEQKLPIDPWVLGAWLGDGHSKTGSLTVGAQDFDDMTSIVRDRWGDFSVTKEKKKDPKHNDVFTVTLTKPRQNECGYGHNQDDHQVDYNSASLCSLCSNRSSRKRNDTLGSERDPIRTNVPLRGLLKDNNLLLNKHIPDIYLRASVEQRLELLRGIMDTDGYFSEKRGHCVLVSSVKTFAESVRQLVRTFGLSTQVNKSVDKKGYTSYRVYFSPVNINPFRMKRKAEKVECYKRRYTTAALSRKIKSIEVVESVPTQCIQVDAADSLYICGDGFNVSHNTGKSKYLDKFQLQVYGLHLKTIDPDIKEYSGKYIVLPEGPKELSYTFTMADVEEAKQDVLKTAEHIATDKTWDPKPQFLCKFCDFSDVCPDSWEKRGSNNLVKIGRASMD
jgi:CRISPR/Cas system-associated exonuclease Cas4 (RecB family)/uncharacterized protein YaaR (DUF327 family)